MENYQIINQIKYKKMRKFNIYKKKIFVLLRFIYLIIFKVLGLLPFQVKISNDGTPIFSTCNFNIYYNIFLIIVLCLNNILVMRITYFPKNLESPTLSHSILTIILLYANSSTIIIWITYIINRKNFINIAKQFLHVNKILLRTKNYVPKNKNEIFIFSFLNILFCVLQLFFSVNQDKFAVLINIMPTYVCSWVLLQYSFALNALNERFTSLNKSLIKLGNISMKIPLQILFVKKNPLDHRVISDIINIRLAYRILCKICDRVSDLFALPTLLGIIYFGSSTIYETYFILISFFTHDKTNINFARAGSLVWFSTQLYDIFILTISVTNTIREV